MKEVLIKVAGLGQIVIPLASGRERDAEPLQRLIEPDLRFEDMYVNRQATVDIFTVSIRASDNKELEDLAGVISGSLARFPPNLLANLEGQVINVCSW